LFGHEGVAENAHYSQQYAKRRLKPGENLPLFKFLLDTNDIYYIIFMKKTLFLSLLFLSLVSCEATKPTSQSSEALAAELAEVKSVLIYVIERGMRASYDQIKMEIEKSNKIWDLKLDESPSIGNSKAKIVIVEFSEFECPFCARITPYLDSITRANPDKIRLVYKHFPLSFHKSAPTAAAAAMAAQKQGKFWEYRWKLAPNFSSLNDSTFIAIAQEIGLNVEQFKKDMVLDADKQAIIDRDMRLGGEVGVQGTPNFYVNGKRQDGFGSQLIEQLLKELY
jgi:protein-disulfide isomerase